MEYKITSVQRRDEWKNSYGNDMMTYAIALEGQQGWHQLNQRLETPPPEVGQSLTGKITNETTKNGKPYKKFTKVNPNFTPQGQNPSPQQDSQIAYIVQMLEELTGRRRAPEQLPEVEEDDPFKDIPL